MDSPKQTSRTPTMHPSLMPCSPTLVVYKQGTGATISVRNFARSKYVTAHHYAVQWKQQLLSFKTILGFPLLSLGTLVKSGGIYIVEDTTTSYWKEYKNYHISPTEYFKKLVDDVNLNGARGNTPVNPPQEFKDWDKGWHRREDCFDNVPAFESIQFMNGFIVIYKK